MDRSVAFFTLGCKVNQYDSQAMLERFRSAGYRAVPFDGDAGIYVINTCTVTGVGDKKSLQLARRVRREHPDSLLILCGCLAQRKAEALLETGAGLILGTQRRMEVVELAERVLATGKPLCAVEPLGALAVVMLASLMTPALPYLLAFAAGAMIYVVVEELIPEASEGEHSNLSTIGFAIGFVLMMVLDVVMG